jgi:hypothetical protein
MNKSDPRKFSQFRFKNGEVRVVKIAILSVYYLINSILILYYTIVEGYGGDH